MLKMYMYIEIMYMQTLGNRHYCIYVESVCKYKLYVYVYIYIVESVCKYKLYVYVYIYCRKCM